MRFSVTVVAASLLIAPMTNAQLQLTKLFDRGEPIINRPGEVLQAHPTTFPQKTAKYWPATDGTSVGFVGASTGATAGYYFWTPNQGLSALADSNEFMPGTSTQYDDFWSQHSVSGNSASFLGYTSDSKVVLASRDGQLESLATLDGPIPNYPGGTYTRLSLPRMSGETTLLASYVSGITDTHSIVELISPGGREVIATSNSTLSDGSAVGPINTSLTPAIHGDAVVFNAFGGRDLILARNGELTRIVSQVSGSEIGFDGENVLYTRGSDRLMLWNESSGSVQIAGPDAPFDAALFFGGFALDDGKAIFMTMSGMLMQYENGSYTALLDLFNATEVGGVPFPGVDAGDFFGTQSFANDTLVFEGLDGAIYALNIPGPAAPCAFALAGLASILARSRRE